MPQAGGESRAALKRKKNKSKKATKKQKCAPLVRVGEARALAPKEEKKRAKVEAKAARVEASAAPAREASVRWQMPGASRCRARLGRRRPP